MILSERTDHCSADWWCCVAGPQSLEGNDLTSSSVSASQSINPVSASLFVLDAQVSAVVRNAFQGMISAWRSRRCKFCVTSIKNCTSFSVFTEVSDYTVMAWALTFLETWDYGKFKLLNCCSNSEVIQKLLAATQNYIKKFLKPSDKTCKVSYQLTYLSKYKN